jgi:hypothetical protein
MRGKQFGIRGLGAVLLLAAGCWTTDPAIKPPPHPDEYVAPPNDLRFTAPPVFPKEAQREFQKTGDDPNGLDKPGKQGPRFGAGGPGMGG